MISCSHHSHISPLYLKLRIKFHRFRIFISVQFDSFPCSYNNTSVTEKYCALLVFIVTYFSNTSTFRRLASKTIAHNARKFESAR